MAEEQAENKPEEQAAPAPEEQLEDKAPFTRLMDSLEETQNGISATLCSAGDGLMSTINKGIRMEDPGEASQDPILFPPKAPFMAAGDILDGGALTPARRVSEITENVGSLLRAAYRSITRPLPFFHLKDTWENKGKYLANIGRIVTSTGNLVRNVINAIPRSVEEVASRAIARPLTRFSGIPVVGRVLGWASKAVSFVGKGIRGIFETITSPLKSADDYMASAQ